MAYALSACLIAALAVYPIYVIREFLSGRGWRERFTGRWFSRLFLGTFFWPFLCPFYVVAVIREWARQ